MPAQFRLIDLTAATVAPAQVIASGSWHHVRAELGAQVKDDRRRARRRPGCTLYLYADNARANLTEITRAQVEADEIGVYLELNMADDPHARTFTRYRLEKIDERSKSI